jgi:hypothetical protein
MKNKFLFLSIVILLSNLLASCESSTNPPGNTITVAPSPTLFVVNEGNFGSQNSSLDAVLFKSDSGKTDTIINHNVISKMGEGNDILIMANHVLVLDNGSNALYVVSADSLNTLATISFGLDAPNKMALISSNLLLVTRRNASSAAIVDLTKNAIVDSIPIGGASIAVAVINNKAYITSGDSEYTGPFHLNVVNLSIDQVEKTLPLPQSPEQAIVDSTNGDVIIGTATDYASVGPKFYFVNTSSDAITDSLSVGSVNDDAELTTGGKHFIILNQYVYPLSGPTHTLPNPLINAGKTLFYKGFYNAASNDLYAGEYNFNIANGKVDVYDGMTGAFKWSFTTGIGPAHFAFYQ